MLTMTCVDTGAEAAQVSVMCVGGKLVRQDAAKKKKWPQSLTPSKTQSPGAALSTLAEEISAIVHQFVTD